MQSLREVFGMLTQCIYIRNGTGIFAKTYFLASILELLIGEGGTDVSAAEMAVRAMFFSILQWGTTFAFIDYKGLQMSPSFSMYLFISG